MHGAAPDGDEVVLAERFRDGDEAALRTIYRRYAGRMHAIARAALRDRDAADDVVQQAFVQAWRAAGRFDPSRSLGPWLFQITRRACIDAFRHESRRPHRTRDDDIASDLPAKDSPSIEQLWERWEVRRAIDELPPIERELVHLAHLQGLTQREISGQLGLPMGTVKSRTFRAHGHLRTALADLAPTPA